MNIPSTVRVKSHDGKIIECRCLPCSVRHEFLRWRDEAWAILQGDDLAGHSQSATMGIQYLFDTSEEFRWLCSQMLAAHGLNIETLDIFQVIELLFLSGEKEDGALVKLQFPPIPPGTGKKLEEGEDPYYSLWASLAYSTGNWMQAKEALDALTYEEVIQVSSYIDKIAKAQNQNIDSPEMPSPVSEAKQEFLMQQAREARERGMQQNAREQQLMAIKRAIQERNKPEQADVPVLE